jgi:hypothetical protein
MAPAGGAPTPEEYGDEELAFGSPGEGVVVVLLGTDPLLISAWRGSYRVGSSVMSPGKTGTPRLSGTGKLNASAIAAVMIEALEKRAAGSFARQRMITIVRAGGIFGLISAGSVGVALTCCIMMVVGLLPWNGRTPVHNSYKITPSE